MAASWPARERAVGVGSTRRALASVAGPPTGPLLEGLTEAILVLDGGFRVVHANAAAEVLLRQPRRLLVDRPLHEVFPGRSIPGLVEQVRRAVATGDPTTFGGFHPGLETWVEARVCPLPDGVAVFLTDAGERKRVHDRHRMLADAGAVVAEVGDIDAMLDGICRLVVSGLADWCVIALVNDRGGPRRAAAAHRDPALSPAVREYVDRYPPDPAGTAVIADAVADRRPLLESLVTPERLLATSRDERHRELRLALGFSSAVAAPLVARGRLLGALYCMAGEQSRRFDAEDRTFVGELAGRVALAVDNAALLASARAELAERRRAEARLEHAAARAEDLVRTAARFNTELDVDSIIHAIPDEIRRVLGAPLAGVSLYDAARDELVPACWLGVPPGFEQRVGNAGHQIYRRFVEPGADLVVVNDPSSQVEPRSARALAELKVRSLVTVAMRYHDELIGVIGYADAGTPAAATPNDLAFLRGLANQAAQAIVNAREVTERKRAEEALRASETRFRALFEHAPVGLALLERGGAIIEANPALAALLGYSQAELRGMNPADLTLPEDRERQAESLRELDEGLRDLQRMEKRYRRRDGRVVWANVVNALARDADGVPRHFFGIAEDITERKRTEEQLRQAQKMEAVGRLAGGVAHDFNNMLGVIIGYADLLLLREDLPADVAESLQEIHGAAERSAALTQQLLAFGRKQIISPRPVRLNDTVGGLDSLLRRLLGNRIKIVANLTPDLPPVHADPNQLEQVLVNLAVNARDSMPNGGRLTIRTWATDIPDDGQTELDPDAVAPGRYSVLSVSDTGHGIDPDALPHIFEPFFTTKEAGQGTGLGLATVYGIVRQNGGFIEVDSTPGLGTTFRVYLPRLADLPESVDVHAAAAPVPSGSGVILLVEDEPLLLRLARDTLTVAGYTVLVAPTGDAALHASDTYDGPIDLLVTDVMMPGLSGVEVADALRERRPGLRVLFTSGYTDDPEMRKGGRAFLPKPYRPSDLASQVRALLAVTD